LIILDGTQPGITGFDDGPGIAVNNEELIFERFMMLPNT
jgi:hypothetical protein